MASGRAGDELTRKEKSPVIQYGSVPTEWLSRHGMNAKSMWTMAVTESYQGTMLWVLAPRFRCTEVWLHESEIT